MNTTAFRHSPRECDRGGLGKSTRRPKPRAQRRAWRAGKGRTRPHTGRRRGQTWRGGEREALSGPGPAGSRVRLVTVPSCPTPPHRLFVIRWTNGLLGSPHAVQHKYSTSSGRPAPGPEASCPGNASLRHLRSFSPSPIHQPRGGGAKDPAPPPSADWIASCSRALLPSLIGWKAHQSSLFPLPVLFLLLLEVYASG